VSRSGPMSARTSGRIICREGIDRPPSWRADGAYQPQNGRGPYQ
jgi:hypothetical protein